jgi:hypothetical protein
MAIRAPRIKTTPTRTTRMDEDEVSVFTLCFYAASFYHKKFNIRRELYLQGVNYTICMKVIASPRINVLTGKRINTQ